MKGHLVHNHQFSTSLLFLLNSYETLQFSFDNPGKSINWSPNPLKSSPNTQPKECYHDFSNTKSCIYSTASEITVQLLWPFNP